MAYEWRHLVLLHDTTSFPPWEETYESLESPVRTKQSQLQSLSVHRNHKTVTVCVNTHCCQITARNLGSALEVCDFSLAGQAVARH